MPWLLLLVPAAVLVVVGLVALVRWALRHETRSREPVQRSWKAFASEIGGHHEDVSGPRYRRRPFRVVATLDGARFLLDSHEQARLLSSGSALVLDAFQVPTGSAVATYTRVRVAVPTSHRVAIQARNALSGIARRLGTQVVEVGDADYDAAFVVKTDDPSWLRGRMTEELRGLHLARPEVALRLKKGELSASREGLLGEHADLRGLLEVARAAARAFG